MSQMIAIVGRPNVGKSTLFNRLTKSRTAITNEEAGTTRDRQYGHVDWNGREFSIIDTGGWVVNSEDIFESEINKQVQLAIEQADEILFVVDAMNGVTDLDDHVAEILRKSRKPVLLVANKVDSNDWLYNVPEFYGLGLGDPYPVSAVNGFGTGDLLDDVVKKLPPVEEDEANTLDDIPKFAIVGRPNAGKSSIVNAFISEERNIVTDIAGTTRDSIYTRYNKFGFDFYLVDTAGIRKKQGQRGHRVLFGYPFGARHRGFGCLHSDDRRHPRHRGAGRQHLLADPTQQERPCCLRQQMGPRGEQIGSGHPPFPRHHPRAFRPLHRFPHHFRLGADETANLQGARNSGRSL